MGLNMAIPAGSQNKAGAWAFISDRLSLDTQLALQQNQINGLPVNIDAFPRIQAGYSPESLEILEDLMARTKYAKTFTDQGLYDIIVSCGEGYLSGDKSLQETVNLIQSRASLYMSEQYG